MDATALSMYAAFGLMSTGALPVTAALRGLEPGDATHRLAGRSLRTLGRVIVRTTHAWNFGVEGAPPADLDRRPCVVVANHASLADPFLLSHLPFDQRFVAKEELFRLPIVGWLLRLAGDIPIRRGDHASAAAMERACVSTLAHGLSVTIFPEGHAFEGRHPARVPQWRVPHRHGSGRADPAGRAAWHRGLHRRRPPQARSCACRDPGADRDRRLHRRRAPRPHPSRARGCARTPGRRGA